MRLWRNGQTDADGVAEALSVSRRRAYQLRADYLAACAAGWEEALRPGLSGGDHRGDWPEEMVDLAAKLLSAKPPANYALIASENMPPRRKAVPARVGPTHITERSHPV